MLVKGGTRTPNHEARMTKTGVCAEGEGGRKKGSK